MNAAPTHRGARAAAAQILLSFLAVGGCSSAAPGGLPSEPAAAVEEGPPPLAEIVSGKRPRWIKLALPFLETAGAELVFLDNGTGVLLLQRGAAVTADLGQTWDVLPPAGVETLYSNNGGKTFVEEAVTYEQWFVKGQRDQTFAVAATAVAGSRLYVFGVGASSNRVSSIALPPARGKTRHRVFWYDGPKTGCLAAAGDTVWAGGDIRGQPVLYISEGEGAAWKPVWWGRTGEPTPRALSFLDAERGVMLLGDGSLHRTTDSGRTWQTAGSLPLEKAPLIECMRFVDDDVGYAVGAEATLLATRDGGRSWLVCKPPTRRTLNRVVAATRETVWVVGDAGTILYSSTGGQTWEKADLGIGENLRAVTLYKDAAWIVGDGALYVLPKDGVPLVAEPPKPDPPVHPFAPTPARESPRDPFAGRDPPVTGSGLQEPVTNPGPPRAATRGTRVAQGTPRQGTPRQGTRREAGPARKENTL